MKGKLSRKKSVTVTFVKSGSNIYGNYFYGDTGVVHFFRGEMISDAFTLKEVDELDQEVRTIRGRFTSEKSIAADWFDPRTNQPLSLKLREVINELVLITPQRFFAENCSYRDKLRPNLIGTSFTEECSYIEIDMIRVTTPSESVNAYVNNYLAEAVCQFGENKNNDIEGFMNSMMVMGSKEQIVAKIKCEIIGLSRNILSVCVISRIKVGEDNQFNSKAYYNFDLRTGAKLNIHDVMVNFFSSKLNPMAESQFNTRYWHKGWGFEKHKFRLPSNFALTSSGVIFEFNPYEMKLDLEAYPSVFFPYKQIVDIINPLSPLAMMLRVKKKGLRLSR